MTSDLTRQRDRIAGMGQVLYGRGLAHGSAGNISCRMDDCSILVTPTNTCLGMLDPARIAHVASDGTLLSGDKPSKETFFHLAMFSERETARAVVHLHCTHSVGVSCLDHDDETNTLPPVTAYHVMKVGKLPLVPYFRPGDKRLAEAVRTAARDHHAMLLSNHGPVVAGTSLEDAVWTSEELEESAKLFFLLSGHKTRWLDAAKIAELERTFPS